MLVSPLNRARTMPLTSHSWHAPCFLQHPRQKQTRQERSEERTFCSAQDGLLLGNLTGRTPEHDITITSWRSEGDCEELRRVCGGVFSRTTQHNKNTQNAIECFTKPSVAPLNSILRSMLQSFFLCLFSLFSAALASYCSTPFFLPALPSHTPFSTLQKLHTSSSSSKANTNTTDCTCPKLECYILTRRRACAC